MNTSITQVTENDKRISKSIKNFLNRVSGGDEMYPLIDMEATGKQIKRIMDYRGITVKQVQDALGLSCVQGIYHWLNGISLPSLDNLYALSELLQVSMDSLICGNRKYVPEVRCDAQQLRLMAYCRKMYVA